MLNDGAFVVVIAGAIPKRRNGLAQRSVRGRRARPRRRRPGQAAAGPRARSSIGGLQGSWESLLSPRKPVPERIIPAHQDPGSRAEAAAHGTSGGRRTGEAAAHGTSGGRRTGEARFPPAIIEKRKHSEESSAELNEGVETDRGSLSISIVAIESGETDPGSPRVVKGDVGITESSLATFVGLCAHQSRVHRRRRIALGSESVLLRNRMR